MECNLFPIALVAVVLISTNAHHSFAATRFEVVSSGTPKPNPYAAIPDNPGSNPECHRIRRRTNEDLSGDFSNRGVVR